MALVLVSATWGVSGIAVRKSFFPVVTPTKEESNAYKSTYLQTRFLLRRNDKKEPKLIWIAIGRNQDQGLKNLLPDSPKLVAVLLTAS